VASGLAGRGPLISVAELQADISEMSPVLLDVRWRLGGPPGMREYAAGHIPGAVFADLDRDLAGPAGDGSGGRHPLPAPDDFTAAMRRAGVRDDRPVVVYDAADSTAAARAWWLLRYFGHPAVRVLDGGFRAWADAGLAIATSEPGQAAVPDAAVPDAAVPDADAREADAREARVPGDFTADPGHMPLLDAASAAAFAREGILLDARAAQRYRGETEPVDPVAGHIPGAVSAPTAENVSGDGTFRTADELSARFGALGVPGAGGSRAGGVSPAGASRAASPVDPAGDRPAVGVYCGSGVTAAHEVLALAVAGVPAALYAGSWSEWITDPSRPVATGGSRG
jgi:thiosulfate/3-mercaptopyruvate sulfurtransferase